MTWLVVIDMMLEVLCTLYSSSGTTEEVERIFIRICVDF